MFNNLKQHHIGCLVASIQEFIEENESIWTREDYSPVYTVEKQDVKVCFIYKTGDTYIELVEPGLNNKQLLKMLAKGTSYYHIAFVTSDYAQSLKDFTAAHCHHISEFRSEAFEGRRCSFFYHPQLKLIELIEGA